MFVQNNDNFFRVVSQSLIYLRADWWRNSEHFENLNCQNINLCEPEQSLSPSQDEAGRKVLRRTLSRLAWSGATSYEDEGNGDWGNVLLKCLTL